MPGVRILALMLKTAIAGEYREHNAVYKAHNIMLFVSAQSTSHNAVHSIRLLCQSDLSTIKCVFFSLEKLRVLPDLSG